MLRWRKQLHTPDHLPLLVIVERILARLEASDGNLASSCVPAATSRSSELASSADLAGDLPQVVSEPIFDIPGLVEAALHQRFDSILCGRSPERSDARIPPGAKFDVRRQTGVDESLGLGDRPFVELGDSRRERLYERI